MDTELATRPAGNGMSVFDRIQNPMEAIKQMGDFLAKSGMFGCEKMEQGQVLALACLCEGKSPFEIMRKFHIIEGKLSMRADAMLAEYHVRGGQYQWKRTDAEAAILVLTYKEFKNYEVEFTIADAQRAGLCGPKGAKRGGQQRDGGWQKTPDAMLRARVVSKGLRMVCPEIISGVYTPEELIDAATVDREETRVALDAKTAAKPAAPAAAKKPAAPVEIDDAIIEPEEQPVAAPLNATPVDGPEAPPETTPVAAKVSPAPGNFQPTENQKAVNEILREQGLLNEGTGWMRKYGWIQETENILSLSEEKCQRVLARPDAFLRAIKTGKAPKS